MIDFKDFLTNRQTASTVSHRLLSLAQDKLESTTPSAHAEKVSINHDAPLAAPSRGAGELVPEVPFFFSVSWNGISSGSSSSLSTY